MIKLLLISVPSGQWVIRDRNLHLYDMISVVSFDKPVVDEVSLIYDTVLTDHSELKSKFSLGNSAKERFS